MLLWLDDFVGYAPALNGAIATDWLYRAYQKIGNTSGSTSRPELRSMAVGEETRICLFGLGRFATAVTPWSVNASLALALEGSSSGSAKTAFVGFKVVGYPATEGYSSVAQFGVFDTTNLLFGLTIINRNRMQITYVESGIVVQENIPLAIPLFGTGDTVELALSKSDVVPMGVVTIWVNNKIVYTGNALPNKGLDADLSWGVIGNTALRNNGDPAVDGYASFGVNPSASSLNFGVNDLYVANNQGSYNNTRLGRVRVTSRIPTGDATPNEWTPSAGAPAGSHAQVLTAIPPSGTQYLHTSDPLKSEMFGSTAFPALGSEEIKGLALRVLANKIDPEGSDVKVAVKSGATTYYGEVQPLTADAQYGITVFDVNPASSLAWTPGDANNTTFGFTSDTGV